MKYENETCALTNQTPSKMLFRLILYSILISISLAISLPDPIISETRARIYSYKIHPTPTKFLDYKLNGTYHGYKIDYNGELSLMPFDLNLKIDLNNYKISNLFKLNSIINEFIKSSLLYNKNISINVLTNIKSRIKDKIFHDAKIKFKILNGKINFDHSIFINKNIGLIEVDNSDLFLKNDRLILTADLTLEIKDTDKLFSFLNTNKKSRKDIKNIKFNIIYDFLSNQIEFKKIKISDKEVSDQFKNIVEGFSDNNFNNLNKSRRLLNELIDIYEG